MLNDHLVISDADLIPVLDSLDTEKTIAVKILELADKKIGQQAEKSPGSMDKDDLSEAIKQMPFLTQFLPWSPQRHDHERWHNSMLQSLERDRSRYA